MQDEFTRLGQELKAKSGAYQDLPDAVVGQAYMRKTNPLQYELLKSQSELPAQVAQKSAIEAVGNQSALELNKAKMQQERDFEMANPKPPTQDEKDSLKAEETAKQAKEVTKALVDEILNRDTGAVTGARNPLKFLTGEAQYTKNLVKQLKAKLSLDARQLLKGTGQISDKETQMLSEAVTALNTNMSNEDFNKELNKIKSVLNNKVPEVTQSKSKQSGIGPVAGGVLGGLGGAIVGGPIGAGAGAFAGAGAGGAIENMIKDALGKQQQTPLEQVGDVTGKAVGAGLTASSIAGLVPGVAKGAGLLKGILKPTPAKYTNEVLDTGKVLVKEGGAIRETAINAAKEAGKKVDGTKLVKGIEEWGKRAKNANPGQKSAIQKIINSAKSSFKGKQLKVDTAKNLWDDANSGFSSAGKVGNSVEAGYHRAVRDVLRGELDKVAPGFEKGTGLIREGLGKEKILKGVRDSLSRSDIKTGLKDNPSKVLEFIKGSGSSVAKGAAGSALTLALYKLLGGKGD